jgi:hypothetical protein
MPYAFALRRANQGARGKLSLVDAFVSCESVARVQLFMSNWLRSLSAIVSIMSHRSVSCGPSAMITTFQESSWGTTEIARPVGHSQMSSISILIADSSSSRVFAGFFKLVPSLRGTGPSPLAIRASAWFERRA